jgi:hypothetical protein
MAGVQVGFLPRANRKRPITIARVRDPSSLPSPPSPDAEKAQNGAAFRGDADGPASVAPASLNVTGDDAVTIGDDGLGPHRHHEMGKKTASQQGFWSGGDDGDDEISSLHNGRVSRSEALTCLLCGGPLSPGRNYACLDCSPLGEGAAEPVEPDDLAALFGPARPGEDDW